jgi:CBS domain-containing protein
MIKNRIHHLAIEENGKISKMLTTHDIMVAQGSSPYFLFREIQAQQRISGLYELSRKIPMIVRPLIEEGAKACNVTRMVSVLNDHVLERLLTLLEEEMGKAPLPFSWLLFGCEGRQEQVFKRRQTNGILYGDGFDDETKNEAQEYFKALSEQALTHLAACGYPPGPEASSAVNAKWRQPASAWIDYFSSWCDFPEREKDFDPVVYFDFRSGAGEDFLVKELKVRVHALARENKPFLHDLIQNCISMEPPLSFYGNSLVEKDGQYRNTLDLEGKGLVFFIDFARAMSLKYGIHKTNTLERLHSLVETHQIPKEFGSELVEAYELLMHIKLVHQLRLIESGLEPENDILPDDLSNLERQTLKEVFEVIRRLQELARLEFEIP